MNGNDNVAYAYASIGVKKCLMRKKIATKRQDRLDDNRAPQKLALSTMSVRAREPVTLSWRLRCRRGIFFFPVPAAVTVYFVLFCFSSRCLIFLSPYQQDLLIADNAHSKLAHGRSPIVSVAIVVRAHGQSVCSNDGGSLDARSWTSGSRFTLQIQKQFTRLSIVVVVRRVYPVRTSVFKNFCVNRVRVPGPLGNAVPRTSTERDTCTDDHRRRGDTCAALHVAGQRIMVSRPIV